MSSLNSTLPMSPLLKPSYPPLWGAFDKLWTSAMGYPADQFRFVVDKTPFSTFWEMASMVCLYVIVIFGGRAFMRNRPALQLNTLFKLHNLFLTILSAGLLALFVEQLIPTLWKHGFYENICGASGWTDPLVTLYYINYITKYIELIDTVFLMVKKKPLIFLHCYHHPATVLLCYTQLTGRTSVSWVPITLNLAVHVVMYWYYFQAARGVKVWWKEWITRLQIAQFVIDLAVVYFACYDFWASTVHPWLPHMGTCAGELYAAVAGCFILSSYLVLFVMFYIATYKTAGKKRVEAGIKKRDIAGVTMKSVENRLEHKATLITKK